MAVIASSIERVFKYNSLEMPAPDDSMTPEEVKLFYAQRYEELLTSEVHDLGVQGTKHFFEFRRAVGNKGAL